jgi:hypothetical protein
MFGMSVKERGPRTSARLKTYFRAHQDVLIDCARRVLRLGDKRADRALVKEILISLKLDSELAGVE